MPSQFYMCLVDGTTFIKRRHTDRSKAMTECERLTKVTKKPVFLLEAVGVVNPPEWTEFKPGQTLDSLPDPFNDMVPTDIFVDGVKVRMDDDWASGAEIIKKAGKDPSTHQLRHGAINLPAGRFPIVRHAHFFAEECKPKVSDKAATRIVVNGRAAFVYPAEQTAESILVEAGYNPKQHELRRVGFPYDKIEDANLPADRPILCHEGDNFSAIPIEKKMTTTVKVNGITVEVPFPVATAQEIIFAAGGTDQLQLRADIFDADGGDRLDDGLRISTGTITEFTLTPRDRRIKLDEKLLEHEVLIKVNDIPVYVDSRSHAKDIISACLYDPARTLLRRLMSASGGAIPWHYNHHHAVRSATGDEYQIIPYDWNKSAQ